ncbi:MAG: hypothetical protein WC897_02445 [Candidatus Gracilibacteria bacterium]
MKIKFLTSTKASTESKKSIAKLIALTVFGIALGIAVSNSLLKFAVAPNINTALWLLVWITLFPLVIGTFSVLIPNQKICIASMAITVIALFSFFITKTSVLVLLITFIVTLLLFWLANHSGKKVYDNMLRFKWLHMGPYVIKPACTALAILLTVLYMVSVPIQDTAFTKPIFTNAISHTGTYLNIISAGTTWDSTIRDFVLNGASAKGTTFKNDVEKEQFVQSAISNLNTSISKQLQTEVVLNPEELLKDVTFRLMDTAIRNIDTNIMLLIVLVLGATIFLTLFYIFRFLSIFTVLLGYVLFKLLGLTKFYSINLENRKKEVLEI